MASADARQSAVKYGCRANSAIFSRHGGRWLPREELALSQRIKYTVLLVDDEPTFLEPVAEVLSLDYQVVTAGSVDDAIRALEVGTVDVVMTDFRMSPKNGIDLLRHMQQTGHPALKLLVTANKAPALAESSGQVKIDEIVDKPVDLMRFLPHLEELLSHRQS